MTHRWSGWPGAWCLDCGISDVGEEAIICDDCQWSGGLFGMNNVKFCEKHQTITNQQKTCSRTGSGDFDPYTRPKEG